MDGRTEGWVDGQREGMEGWKDGRREGAGGEIGGWVVKGQTDRGVDGQRYGWMERQVNGWADGGMGGWTEGQTDRQAAVGCLQPSLVFTPSPGPIPTSCLSFPGCPAPPPREEADSPSLGSTLGLPACCGGPQLPPGSHSPQPLVWEFGLGSGTPGPATLCQLRGLAGGRGGQQGPLGAASRRWWQRGFSPAVADSRESHVLPG